MPSVMSAVEARNNFGRVLNIVSITGEDVIIQRAGKTIARVVPANAENKRGTEKLDFRKTRGLGKKLWEKIDVEKHIRKEREEWN